MGPLSYITTCCNGECEQDIILSLFHTYPVVATYQRILVKVEVLVFIDLQGCQVLECVHNLSGLLDLTSDVWVTFLYRMTAVV